MAGFPMPQELSLEPGVGTCPVLPPNAHSCLFFFCDLSYLGATTLGRSRHVPLPALLDSDADSVSPASEHHRLSHQFLALGWDPPFSAPVCT